jgi:serine/threonine protein kinase
LGSPSRELPRRVGRYVLVESLGEGGMSHVHRARAYAAAGVTKDVCVKRIRDERLTRRGAVERFIEEARVSMSLAHGNIVPVFDFGRAGGEYFLAMEWIDGADLRAIAKDARVRGAPLRPEVVAHVGAEVARALAYAHDRARPVVHRDVKPANVLTSRHGEVKLGDFGIARAESRLHQTQPGLARGTPSYMAPEVHATQDQASIASDLFSVGIVLLEMLTLRRSYLKKTPGSQAQDLRLPKSLGTERVERLEIFFRRALAPQPANRFDTADEMKNAFLEALEVQPADAGIIAEVIAVYEPQARQPDSTELNAFRPADLTESDERTE